jgi:hypothetical protein
MSKKLDDPEAVRIRRSGSNTSKSGSSTPNWRSPSSSLPDHQTRSRGAALTEDQIRDQNSGFKLIPLRTSPGKSFSLHNLTMPPPETDVKKQEAEAKKAEASRKAAEVKKVAIEKKEYDRLEALKAGIRRDEQAAAEIEQSQARITSTRLVLQSEEVSSDEDGNNFTEIAYGTSRTEMIKAVKNAMEAAEAAYKGHSNVKEVWHRAVEAWDDFETVAHGIMKTESSTLPKAEAEQRILDFEAMMTDFTASQRMVRKKIKYLKQKDEANANRGMEDPKRKPTRGANTNSLPPSKQSSGTGGVNDCMKAMEAAQEKIEKSARGLDKVEENSDEEKDLGNAIYSDYNNWLAYSTSAEITIKEMTGADSGVYWQRLGLSKTTLRKIMEKVSRHFDNREPEDEEDEDEEDAAEDLNTTDEAPTTGYHCSTPGPKVKKSGSVTFNNLEVGLDTFTTGVTNKNRGKRPKDTSKWDEQSFLDQDTLLDNLVTRRTKKVSWNDFYSKNHTRRYYCPSEKRVSGDFKINYTFSGRNAADWDQARKRITTMILNRRYMNFDEKLLRLQEMMTDKAAFMIKDADQDEDGLIYALKTLENEFGGYEDTERALVCKLGSLEKMDITRPVTIDNFKFSVIQLIRLICDSGRDYRDHEQMILAHQRFEEQTRILYEGFRQNMRQRHNSLRLFFHWAKYHTNRMHDTMQAKAIMDDWRKPEQWKNKNQEHPKPQAVDTQDKTLCVVDKEGSDTDDDIICAIRDALQKSLCKCCGQPGHKVITCYKFDRYTYEERMALCKKENLCERCLKGIHPIGDCYKKEGCADCGSMDHHVKLHTQDKVGELLRAQPESKMDEAEMMKLITAFIKKAEAKAKADTVGLTSVQGTTDDIEDDFVGFALDEEMDLGKIWRTTPVRMSMTKRFKKPIKSNMLIDEGSSATLLDTETGEKRGFEGKTQVQRITTVGNKCQTITNKTGFVYLQAMGGGKIHKVKCSTFALPKGIKPPKPEQLKKRFPVLKDLELDEPAEGGMQILLGFDNQHLLRSLGDFPTKPCEPSVRKTIWGNTVLWHPEAARWDSQSESTCLTIDGGDETLDEQALAAGLHPNSDEHLTWILKKSWEVETAALRREQYGRTRLTVAEASAVRTMETSVTEIAGGGYEVAVPWRPEEPNYQRNQTHVKWMTEKMEAKIYGEEAVGAEVDKTFMEYLTQGFIKPVPKCQESEGYYITWFCVVRPEKETTKVRTVFNCAQTFGKGEAAKCLNDGMYTGPKLHNELFDIIMRMRERQVFVGADISKFYMRIRMAEKDQKYHRFYWRGKPYQFTRWPFGNKAAPFAALYVVQNHIRQHGSTRLQQAILPCMYMDDILFSVDTVEEAQVIIKEMRQIFLLADMPLSKWVSSHPEALKDIPKEEQSKDMFLEDPEGHSTLGVGWKPDKLTFKPKTASEGNLTRRRIASIVSSIFDPHGWLAPYTLEGRTILQGICKKQEDLSIMWDTDLDKMGEQEPVIKQLLRRFRKWEQQLPLLDQISYPRPIYKNKPITHKQLQIFTDGALHAYATMAYVKVTYQDGEKSLVFLCCVRRITPMHGRSTPETELMGAVTGAETGKRLSLLLNIQDVRYWTDSTPVLTWIRKAGKKNKVFVVHRTTAIHDLSNTEHWDYVPTQVNPADLPTRGCSISELQCADLFWNGPKFILEDEGSWPRIAIAVSDEERFPTDTILMVDTLGYSWITQGGTIKGTSTGLEATVWPATDQAKTALAVVRKAHKAASVWPVGNFSRWSRALRTMARTKAMFKHKTQDASPIKNNHIREEYLMEAAASLIIMAQVLAHEEEILYFGTNAGKWPPNSKLGGNAVYFDKFGMMRVASRAQLQPDMSLASKFPIWFPKKTWVGRLILRHEHNRRHSKTTRLAQECMSRFYCNGFTQVIKEVCRSCVTCQKKYALPGEQIMGQIPDRRLGSLKPFSLVSMDACGHWKVKILNSSMKVWVLVLTCLQTKAVHLEVMEGLKTEEVINALERAVARRGVFEEIHADNFSSFVATKTILSHEQEVRRPEGMEDLDWDMIKDRVSEGVWKWTFSKPYSSEGNGVAEAMVKLTKDAMYTAFRHIDVRLNEFRTIVTKAEARVNSRPIATFSPSDDWENIQILTPMHYNIGQFGGEAAPQASETSLINLPDRWNLVQKHSAKYAKIWKQGWAATLLGNHKWASMVKEMSIGDIVIVIDEDGKRHDWPLGIVTALTRSGDGVVRAVSVRTRCMEGQRPTTLTRNVRELVPLTFFDDTTELGPPSIPRPAKKLESKQEKAEVAQLSQKTLPAKVEKTLMHPASDAEVKASRAAGELLRAQLPDEPPEVAVDQAAKVKETLVHPASEAEIRQKLSKINIANINMALNAKEPDSTDQNQRKVSRKTPLVGWTEGEGSGNTEKVDAGVPDTPPWLTDNSHQKTPESQELETTQGNDNKLPGAVSTEYAKIDEKTPKRRRYKTEVEKLKEMLFGGEMATSRRSDIVNTVENVSNDAGNNLESIKTHTKGDGPKTGPVE